MTSVTHYTLKWTYTPNDFFEEVEGITGNGYVLTIGEGLAEATIEPEIYESDPTIAEKIHTELESRFLAVQLFELRQFQLQVRPNITLPDGATSHTLYADNIISAAHVFDRVDILIRDPDGTVIGDTKRDRIDKKRRLAELVARHAQNDSTLAAMVNSFDASISDPDNFLVRLYEIRDALQKKFRGQKEAQEATDISNSNWRELGRLADSEPLRQGRHRGKNVGQLRDATRDETETAFSIARDMIEKYLLYLEKNASSTQP